MKELFTDTDAPIVDSNRILYTASPFARSSLLHLQEIGELTALQPHESSRAGLNSFLFFEVVSGAGLLTYNGKSYNLTTGDCVFIDCRNPYSHETGSVVDAGDKFSAGSMVSSDDTVDKLHADAMDDHALWTLRWIHFNGPMLPAIYDKYCERGGQAAFSPDNDKQEEINSLWTELFSTASCDSYMRDMLINQHLSTLLTIIMSESWHPENQEDLAPKQSVVLAVKQYLDENYGEKITLDELSSHFYINKYYLTKTFKSQYGISINHYLLNLRITKAKQLLRFSDESIEQIGIECGLGSAQYFSNRFKEIEGVSPKTYREQW